MTFCRPIRRLLGTSVRCRVRIIVFIIHFSYLFFGMTAHCLVWICCWMKDYLHSSMQNDLVLYVPALRFGPSFFLISKSCIFSRWPPEATAVTWQLDGGRRNGCCCCCCCFCSPLFNGFSDDIGWPITLQPVLSLVSVSAVAPPVVRRLY